MNLEPQDEAEAGGKGVEITGRSVTAQGTRTERIPGNSGVHRAGGGNRDRRLREKIKGAFQVEERESEL